MKATDCCLWSVPKWLYPRTECAIEDALVVQAIVMTCGRFGGLVFALQIHRGLGREISQQSVLHSSIVRSTRITRVTSPQKCRYRILNKREQDVHTSQLDPTRHKQPQPEP
jgi:hypothetical protein